MKVWNFDFYLKKKKIIVIIIICHAMRCVNISFVSLTFPNRFPSFNQSQSANTKLSGERVGEFWVGNPGLILVRVISVTDN